MTRSTNRREDLLDAALAAFVDRGYEGTSIADLAAATGLSKAAFVYHFASKEALLFELAGPLLDELDDVVERHENPSTPTATTALLTDYLDALCRHRSTAVWVDGDKSILNHGDLGARLDRNNERLHQLIAGHRPTPTARASASAVLGMLWRPIRNGYLADDRESRDTIVAMASSAAAAI